MNISDVIYSYLPSNYKRTPSGWCKFNAVCCTYNGTSKDTRARGGLIQNAQGFSYHCFNCGFKTSYVIGRPISKKMRRLLTWLNIPTDIINKLILDALKLEANESHQLSYDLPILIDKELPANTIPLIDAVQQYPKAMATAEYLLDRGFDFDDYSWCWTPDTKCTDRLIIPFFYENRIVGWTARKITKGAPKYIADQTPGYVFNLDQQHDDRKFIILVEGPLDAISIQGAAVLGSEISDHQARLISQLGKQVIVVPDRDNAGLKLVNRAIELNWAVSIPEWDNDIKDINDAIQRYGRIYTLYSIIEATETYELKILLKLKKWRKLFGN